MKRVNICLRTLTIFACVVPTCVLGKINKLWCLCAKLEHNFPVNAGYKGSYGQKIWF